MHALVYVLEADCRMQWTFLTFLAIFELGALISAASVSSTMFIVGRAIGGIGGAGLMNGALTIIASAAPITQRPSTSSFREASLIIVQS